MLTLRAVVPAIPPLGETVSHPLSSELTPQSQSELTFRVCVVAAEDTSIVSRSKLMVPEPVSGAFAGLSQEHSRRDAAAMKDNIIFLICCQIKTAVPWFPGTGPGHRGTLRQGCYLLSRSMMSLTVTVEPPTAPPKSSTSLAFPRSTPGMAVIV